MFDNNDMDLYIHECNGHVNVNVDMSMLVKGKECEWHTYTSETPSSRRSTFSIALEHDEHVMPSTTKEACCVVLLKPDEDTGMMTTNSIAVLPNYNF